MKVSKAHYHGLTRWRVSWRTAGKTKRKFFASQVSARRFAKDLAFELAEHGEAWAKDRDMVIAAWRRSKAFGYSLSEACKFWEKNHL